jgi:choline dehydrogenase-like flavoprotein
MTRGGLLQFSDVSDREHVEDNADVIIIGSGAAGATAARVLTEAGVDVVLLEEGPLVRSEELRSDMYSSFKRVWRDMGFQVAQGRSFTPILQGSCIGGTTAINGAIMHRLPESVHAEWTNDYAIGEPFSARAFARVFDQLDKELFVGTAPEEVLGENSKRMREAVRALGMSGHEIRRNVKNCQGSAHCNQGCPTASRQSMNVSFVPRAIEHGARVYANCRAERLLNAKGRASGVAARFVANGRKGPRLTVHARHAVVVAASAIQSPLLLLENGIGRSSGLVGRRLQVHPGTAIVGVFDRPVGMWFGATQGYETLHYWDDRMKFETVGMPLELVSARLPSIGRELMQDLEACQHLAIWGVEVRARTHGRVTTSLFERSSISLDFEPEDVQAFKRGVWRLAEMMFAAGAREVMPGVHGLPDRVHSLAEMGKIFDLPDDPRLMHCIAAHLFGTAIMGKHASRAVVNQELESFDLPGLYVFDSSVFPTNIGVNPQHTISAVSWLAAERLAQRIKH